MSEWTEVLLEPAGLGETDRLTSWFDDIASWLLRGSRVLVAGEPHRFTEVEFYYYGGSHHDAFTHRDPIQKECGRWYFHRTRGVYRSGSFKGFDLTFGGPDAFGGVLIRGLEADDGTLIDGPSLCVDHLLARTKASDVAVLDGMIAGRKAWEAGNPMVLHWLPDLEDRPIYSMARVGITLKRYRPGNTEATRYVMRPYRYLSEPRRIAKGKVLMVCGLHARGTSAEEVCKITGCPKGTVARYLEDFEAGRREADFGPYFGIDPGPRELCRLNGVWQAVYGQA
jgi:hypothetical protein